jgi:hypothetical protein
METPNLARAVLNSFGELSEVFNTSQCIETWKWRLKPRCCITTEPDEFAFALGANRFPYRSAQSSQELALLRSNASRQDASRFSCAASTNDKMHQCNFRQTPTSYKALRVASPDHTERAACRRVFARHGRISLGPEFRSNLDRM